MYKFLLSATHALISSFFLLTGKPAADRSAALEHVEHKGNHKLTWLYNN